MQARLLDVEAKFDPFQLTPAASLNRLIIGPMDLPVPDDLRGKTGYEVASAQALSGMIRRRGEQLELSPVEAELSDQELPLCLERRLASADAPVGRYALEIVQEFTRNLAYLLLAIIRRNPAHDVGYSWQREYWKHWGRVRTVIFGGGLLSGLLGKYLAEALPAFWAASGFEPRRFRVAPDSAHLALRGAARFSPRDAGQVIAFDFGGTQVKRSIFQPHGQSTHLITPLAPIPVPAIEPDIIDSDPDGTARRIFDFMVGTICETWLAANTPGTSATLPVSVAAYINDGHPMPRQGGTYATLSRMPNNASQRISDAVSEHVKRRVAIELIHDGAAAAMNFRHIRHGAVITLGTALGIGFTSG